MGAADDMSSGIFDLLSARLSIASGPNIYSLAAMNGLSMSERCIDESGSVLLATCQ